MVVVIIVTVNRNIDNVSSFKEFIALYKDDIYNRLVSYFPTSGPAEFNKMAMTYTERKGQYRRPSYIMLWNRLYGGVDEEAILPAAAQQASEDYFLMHDDWMDGNTVRRNGPAAHVLFGERHAITAGSMVHAITWRIAHDAAKALGEERGNAYFSKFYDTMIVTHQGQYLDVRLTREVKDITKFTKEDYFKSIHAKSAYYSVYGPMQCGAIIAGADDDTVSSIKEYGVPAGNAFQIKDDILDCVSDQATLGKSIGNDVRDGVKTIILWHAVQNASQAQLDKLKSIYMKDRPAKTEEEVSWVLNLFNELNATQLAQKDADALVSQAVESFKRLSSELPESKLKEIAAESIGYAAKRNV
ncbi:polyprenyl synthetase family protein [Candidatus Marsarchaeota archaeon]|nr:polyprenyl synthetase family protein [Candidatus Marsarchaeota archaeon]